MVFIMMSAIVTDEIHSHMSVRKGKGHLHKLNMVALRAMDAEGVMSGLRNG